MKKYDKYLVEGRKVAGSIAELAIEKMEDTLADFEMFINEKATSPGDKMALGLKADFYRMFDKQWESMKKDLIIFSRKLDSM